MVEGSSIATAAADLAVVVTGIERNALNKSFTASNIPSNINSASIDAKFVYMERLVDHQRLRAFLAVAHHLSFRKAAAQLHIAQPAVSRYVKALEDDLGFALLVRTTRRVELTEAGALFAVNAQEAVNLLQHAVRAAQMTAKGEAGTLSVAYSALTAYGVVPKIVLQFKNEFPGAEVSLFLMSSVDQISAISEGAIDAGFALTAACGGGLPHIPVSRERLVVLASKYEPIAKRTTIALKDLRGMPFVFGTMNRWRTFRSVVESACLRAGVLPDVVEEADDMPVLLRLVSLGRGITLFSESVLASLPPDIVGIPLSDKHARLDFSLVWSDKHRIPLVRSFIECARATSRA